ncbi:unnamed protein product, partial [Plutella xylostella]
LDVANEVLLLALGEDSAVVAHERLGVVGRRGVQVADLAGAPLQRGARDVEGPRGQLVAHLAGHHGSHGLRHVFFAPRLAPT